MPNNGSYAKTLTFLHFLSLLITPPPAATDCTRPADPTTGGLKMNGFVTIVAPATVAVDTSSGFGTMETNFLGFHAVVVVVGVILVVPPLGESSRMGEVEGGGGGCFTISICSEILK